MCAAIVVLLVLLAVITSLHPGPEFVPHECTRCQPDTAVIVSAQLCHLLVNRRLLAVTDRVYRPRPHCSPPAVLVALLLLLGGVESNPGPSVPSSSSMGLLNARSARHKAPLIHDVITNNRLDLLLLTETWITSDAPDAVKLDVAPPGYSVVHQPRGSSTEQRGGGLAVIHRECVRATPVHVGDYSEFESLTVKLVGRRSASIVVVCVCRPPGAVTTTFINQLSDPLDQLIVLDLPFVNDHW